MINIDLAALRWRKLPGINVHVRQMTGGNCLPGAGQNCPVGADFDGRDGVLRLHLKLLLSKRIGDARITAVNVLDFRIVIYRLNHRAFFFGC
jgi:hypothetical protein